jgi:hypothetical protein
MAKRDRLTTPVGQLKWAYLSEPNTRWKDEGVFSVCLTLPEDHPFLKQLDELAEAGTAEVKKTLKKRDAEAAEYLAPYNKEYDSEDNETGRVEIKFSTAAYYTDKKTGSKVSLKPKVFDAGGKLVRFVPAVGNGSEGAVNFSYAPFYMPATKKLGLKCYLNAVQIVKLVEYAADASQFGFGKTEGGFDASDVEERFDSAETEGADAQEGDF